MRQSSCTIPAAEGRAHVLLAIADGAARAGGDTEQEVGEPDAVRLQPGSSGRRR